MPTLFRSLPMTAALLLGVLLACRAATADDFETPPIASAADLLPPELLAGEFHTVDDAVRSDGYLNYYMIRSEFGDFEAASTGMLRVRIREIGALAELDDVTRTEVFIKAAADAGIVAPLRTVRDFATDPIDTVIGIPAGIGRLFKRTKRQVSDGLETAGDIVNGDDDEEKDDGNDAGDVTDTATSLTRRYFGVSGAERAWHRELGTDPYTSNEALQKAVKNVAWADRLGRFGIRAAGLPSIPGVGVLADINDVVWSKDPYELQDLNSGRLREAGADEALIDKFLETPWLSPTQQTYLAAAIADLDGADGRPGIVRESLMVRTEAEARFFVRSVVMLAWYHMNERPVTRVIADMAIPIGVRADDTAIALAAADRVYWSETVAEAAAYHRETTDLPDTGHELWLSGGVSERARRELAALGWDIRENVTIMAAGESAATARDLAE